MAAELVTITWTEQDIGQAGLNGSVKIVLSGEVFLGPVSYEPLPKIYQILNSAGQTTPPILANDTPGLQPNNSYYTISVLIPGLPPRTFSAFVNFANGPTQTLTSLTPIVPAANYGAYMPLTGASFTGGVGPAVKTLSDAATVTIDAALVNEVTIPLTQNTLLVTPLNPKPAQKLVVKTVMGSPGSFVLSYSAAFAFLSNPGAPVPVLGTAPGSRNYLLFDYDAGLAQWVLLAFL